MAKVSIIVPVYGVEKHIEKCARSLFEQTAGDLEYVFVNDCTKDESIFVLKRVISCYPGLYSRIKIIEHSENRGLPAARQTGVENSTGDYIYHCDSDDWVDSTLIEVLYNAAIQNDYDLVYCDFYLSYPNKSIRHVEINSTNYFESILLDKCSPNVWNKLCKRSIYNDNIIYYPEFGMCEDFVLTLQLAYYSKRINYVRKALYYYRINPDSMTNELELNAFLKRFEDVKKNYDSIYKFIKLNNINIKYVNKLNIRLFKSKSLLYPVLYNDLVYDLWKEIYSEFSLIYFLSCRISIVHKIRYILYYIRILPIKEIYRYAKKNK